MFYERVYQIPQFKNDQKEEWEKKVKKINILQYHVQVNEGHKKHVECHKTTSWHIFVFFPHF